MNQWCDVEIHRKTRTKTYKPTSKPLQALFSRKLSWVVAPDHQILANYRDFACEYDQTRSRCAEKSIRYEPVVFTTQGGVEPHGEALLSQIAEAIAAVEGGW